MKQLRKIDGERAYEKMRQAVEKASQPSMSLRSEAINRNGRVGSRLLEILMCNVSTRNYQKVIPGMVDTVGVSKSSVSRQLIEESGQELERLAERRFEGIELLTIYIDGLAFGEHHVICAVGVDTEGRKHVLGIQEGASENAATATSLLGFEPQRCEKLL